MPRPDVFSERKSSSMMTMGKRNFIGVPVFGGHPERRGLYAPQRGKYGSARRAFRDTAPSRAARYSAGRADPRGPCRGRLNTEALGIRGRATTRGMESGDNSRHRVTIRGGKDDAHGLSPRPRRLRPRRPHADWPGGARVAVQFVLNYEEGGENNVLHGDAGSESVPVRDHRRAGFPARHMSMESIYEYGSRAGVWRILRAVRAARLPLTVFGVAMALERNPEVDRRVRRARPRDRLPRLALDQLPGVRRGHRARAHARRRRGIIRRITGAAPLGWYTGRDSPNTRRLVVEHGGFVYDADYYGDDLPFWTDVETAAGSSRTWSSPTRSTANDMRFATPQGFNTGDAVLRLPEGRVRRPLRRGRRAAEDDVGRHALPPRSAGPALRRARSASSTTSRGTIDVWICRRIDIARHWIARHPFVPG